MPARFRVHDTFTLQSRRMFVIAGDIVEGTVRVGMQVEVPLNDSLSVTAPVAAVEFVDGPGPQSRVGLGIRYEDDDELEMLRGLNIGGCEILTVSEPEGGISAPEPVRPPRRPWWKQW